jgi:hypothetical protein
MLTICDTRSRCLLQRGVDSTGIQRRVRKSLHAMKKARRVSGQVASLAAALVSV